MNEKSGASKHYAVSPRFVTANYSDYRILCNNFQTNLEATLSPLYTKNLFVSGWVGDEMMKNSI